MNSIDSFISLCKSKGLNVTYQRIAVYRYLIQNPIHPTAEDVFKAVKKDYPTISLATVYKTLETMAKNNIITKVTLLHDVARYDGQIHAHHHMVCNRCKKVVDIENDQFHNLDIELKKQKEFRVLKTTIQIEGICSNCEYS